METIKATNIQVGDVLDMVIGPALVLGVKLSHGGIECRVPNGSHRKGSPYLWFYPANEVRVLRRQPQRAARIIEATRNRSLRLATLKAKVLPEEGKAV